MRILTFCRILTHALSLALFSEVVVAQSPVGIFDAQTDVGRVLNTMMSASRLAVRVGGMSFTSSLPAGAVATFTWK